MSKNGLEDLARQFLMAKGWEAKNQAVCKAAKIFHRTGLIKFAEMVDWDIEELETAYAIKITLQKKNRRRRGQKPIKKPKAQDVFKGYADKSLLHWQGSI